MFNLNSRKSAILVALLVLLSAGIGGVVMAEKPTVDEETTDTDQESDIVDDGAQTYNQTTSSNLTWIADSNNSKVVVEQGNDTLYEASPDPYDHDAGGNNDSYYNVSLDDDGSDYDGLDADAGEDVELNVTFINDTDADEPDERNISYTFENGESEAFEDVEGDGVVGPSEDGFFSGMNVLADDDATDPAKTDTDAGVAGEGTETITVSVADTDMADAFNAAAEGTESGDMIWASATSLEGDYVVVSNEEEPDTDWFDDEQTYATYDEDSETLTYHNVDESVDEDAEEVELSATGNDGLGLFNTASMLKSHDVTSPYVTAALNADWNEPEWEDEE